MSHPFQTARDVRENPANILREIAEGMVDGKTVLGVDHESFDRAAEHLEQPVLTEQNYLDLSQIQPLTEAQAEEYFNKPTITEKYHAAMRELSQTYEYLHADIEAYVAQLKVQIDNAYRDGREHAWTRPGYGEMGG